MPSAPRSRTERLSAIASAAKRVVLVGGGHAHLEVLLRWRRRAAPAACLCVIVDEPRSVYSGMVPGFVAGEYGESELTIDVGDAASRAGAELIVAEATRIDPERKRVLLRGEQPIEYDIASLNVGSTVRGLDLPGVARHALATRPIGEFVRAVAGAMQARTDRLREAPIVVVGGGIAGIELAFCLGARARKSPAIGNVAVVVLDRAAEPLAGHSRGFAARIERAMARAGISLRAGEEAVAVTDDGVLAGSGRRHPAALVVWATGGAPAPLIAASDFVTDRHGFVLTNDELEVLGADGLFAAGDCSALRGRALLPRAGVYAVRQGPVLFANISRALSGRPRSAYRPQRDVLAIVNLGDGTAVATKHGVTLQGRSVRRWKDWLDRRFISRHTRA